MRKLPVSEEPRILPDEVLEKYGAGLVRKKKGELIFREGEHARSFFLVRSGSVKMVNVNEDGKEFVQGYFRDGESFGEPPFITESAYPASAIAASPSEIWTIGRAGFLRLLRENFDIHLAVTRALGLRLIHKSVMLSEIAIEEAEHRIRTLLTYLRESGRRGREAYVVPFSRQQLADMAGLRVETVIRIVKNLEQKKAVKLTKEGKIRLD